MIVALLSGLAGIALVALGCGAEPKSLDISDETINQAVTFTCAEFTTTNYLHVKAGRAQTYQYGIMAKAVGSGDSLGMVGNTYWSPTTTVAETASGYFKAGQCPSDNQPPEVTILSPQDGATVSGLLELDATASDDVGVTAFEYQFVSVEDELLEFAVECGAGPFKVQVDTSIIDNGDYILKAKAEDALGNVGWSQGVHIIVANSFPVVEFLSPADGAVVSGEVTFRARASDPSGIQKVLFATLVVGSVVCEASAPNADGVYECVWDSTELTSGNLTVVANAKNNQGNDGYSQEVHLTISNQCRELTATNYLHVKNGRAERVLRDFSYYAKTKGAGDDLGFYGSAWWSPTTTVRETSPGYFEKGSCPK